MTSQSPNYHGYRCPPEITSRAVFALARIQWQRAHFRIGIARD
jgi:hypothetical protein